LRSLKVEDILSRKKAYIPEDVGSNLGFAKYTYNAH
jgi:hypothetical protein